MIVDFDKKERISNLVFLTGFEVANRSEEE